MKHIFLTLIFSSFSLFSFELEDLNGKHPKWDISTPICYSFDSTCTEEVKESAKRCMALWAEASAGYISFKEDDTAVEKITFFWISNFGNVAGAETTFFSFRNGEAAIVGAEIYINSKKAFIKTPADIIVPEIFYMDDTMLHEIGHALGFEHVNDSVDPKDPQTMAVGSFLQGSRSSLHRDEIEGLRFLYNIPIPVDSTIRVDCIPAGNGKYTFLVSGEVGPITWLLYKGKSKKPKKYVSNMVTVKVSKTVYNMEAHTNGMSGSYILDLRKKK